MRCTQSPLFLEIWEKHKKKAATAVQRKERSKLVIEDIKTVLWIPTFEECVYLLKSLHDRSILLEDIDKYFESIKQEMNWHLKKLNTGIRQCGNTQTPESGQWIDKAVEHINEYWSLLTLSKAAEIVIELKNKLGLTGDFKAIERLAYQVRLIRYNYWPVIHLFIVSGDLLHKRQFIKVY